MLKWGMSVAGAALATAFVTGSASAQVYVTGNVGWNQLDRADTTVENGISPGVDMIYKVNTDDNFVGRAGVGLDVGALRFEAEFGMSQNDVSEYTSTAPPNVTLRGDGALQLLTATGNVYYDFDMGGGITPYVGIGYGAFRAELEVSGPRPTAPTGPVVTLLDNDQTNLGWQLMAGLAFPLGGNLTATAGARIFDAGTMDTNDPQGRATHIDIKGSSLDLGMRMAF
jgi:opacity protein-like surface antigen